LKLSAMLDHQAIAGLIPHAGRPVADGRLAVVLDTPLPA